MTNREVLEYSKQIISAKSEIDTSQQAEPDLEDQVKNKFNEDSVNRARFIDNTLIIGAASKEFRNVFGVDAPHYEISDDCYLAIDRDGDGKYYTKMKAGPDGRLRPDFDDGENLTVVDPMNNNEETTYFLDCWQMMNAARFDSTMKCSNNNSDSKDLLFVEKQDFFIDSKADSESSPAHNPICPPGYEMWSGDKVYDGVCKCFDLDELNLYRLIGGTSIQTIPSRFEIHANAEDKLQYNINEDGDITKNHFKYKYVKSWADGKIVDTDDNPIIEASQQSQALQAGCTPIDIDPVKWYKYRVVDNVTKVGDGYNHDLNLADSPFANCDLSIAEFELINEKNGESFNNGYAILARNQAQPLPSVNKMGPGYFDIEYSINILYRAKTEDGNFDRGNKEVHEKERRFLWWKWTKTTVDNKNYKIVFTPVKGTPGMVKSKIANFIMIMENDCLKYYDWMKQRELKNMIPDNDNKSYNTISALYNMAKLGTRAYDNIRNKLKERVVYDITGKVSGDAGYSENVVSRTSSYEYGATAQHVDTKTYIKEWVSRWIPGWPKWLRRLFKKWSDPVYQDFYRIKLDVNTIEKNFLYSSERNSINSYKKYFGPKSGDLTKTFWYSNNMKTPTELVTVTPAQTDPETGTVIEPEKRYLTDDQIQALVNAHILSSGKNTSPYMYIPNSTTPGHMTIGPNQKCEFIIQDNYKCKPTYTEIKRASDIHNYLKNNLSLYFDAFSTLSDRINKRTGTLRKTFSLLESTNINVQMIEQRKRNLANLFSYMNAYEITGGFGTDTATIKLASFEPETSAYSNLERLGTVYLFADNTVLNKKTDKFEQNFLNTTITDIIDKVSDAQYTYTITEDPVVVPDKTYYVYDDDTGKYRVADSSEKVDDNIAALYERSIYPSQGPVFTVTLADKIPKSLEGKNPRLVKIF